MSYEKIISYWTSSQIKTRADLEAILNGQIINFAYHSGKIENDNITYNDTRDIFERDTLSNYTGGNGGGGGNTGGKGDRSGCGRLKRQ